MCIGALAALALTTTACAGAGDASGGSNSAKASKSNVTIALAEEPRTLANWDAYASDGAPVLYNVEEPLVTLKPPNYKLSGVLATSWKRVGTHDWHFDLRKGVRFQDGSPFNAQAAAYAINYTFSKKNGFPIRQFQSSQTTAHAISTYVLDVHTAAPNPLLPNELYGVVIPSMKQLKSNPKQYAEHPIGTGPYEFVNWKRGSSISLKVNPNWWGDKAGGVAGPRPSFQTVTFTFNTNTEARAAEVQAGGADLAQLVLPGGCKPSCLRISDNQDIFLRFDDTNPMFKSKLVREAIALAVSVNQVASKLVPGGKAVGQMDPPYVSGANNSLSPYQYDLPKAKRLLAQAAKQGVPVKNPIKLVYEPGYVPNSPLVSAYISQQLTKLGLNVKIVTYPNEQINAGISEKAPPNRGWLTLYMHSTNAFDESDAVDTYEICNGVETGYCNPALDKQVAKANTLSGSARDAAYKAIGKVLYDNYAVVPIAVPSDYYAASPTLEWTPRTDELILVNYMKRKS